MFFITPTLFIANEAFRGLPQWQAVLREGSAVPCTTGSWVPIGRGVISEARSMENILFHIMLINKISSKKRIKANH